MASCEARAAAEKENRAVLDDLRKGSVESFMRMEFSAADDLARLEPSAPFYAGLLVEAAGDKARAARLYEAALGSPVKKVVSEAVRKLVPVLAETKEPEQAKRVLAFINKRKSQSGEFVVLKNAALYALGRSREIDFKDSGEVFPVSEESAVSENAAEALTSWNLAFVLLSAITRQDPGPITDSRLASFLCDRPVNAAYQWAFTALSALEEYTAPEAVKAAALGRIAASKREYSQALIHFSTVRKLQSSLLFRHPELLSDLGRAFVVSDREAGFELFTAWEEAIRTGENSPLAREVSAVSGEAEFNAADRGDLRYTLLFYAGRIRRQAGAHDEAGEIFSRALPLAPDNVQKDACIWYILSSALNDDPGSVPALIDRYSRLWHRDGDFADILDRLSVYLVTNKKWSEIADVFSSIRNGKDGATIARYAYLAGRAVSLGWLPERNLSAADFFNAAYEKADASFYYRALAASYLGRTVVPVRGMNRGGGHFPHAEEMEFFVLFFEFGADDYALGYVRENAGRYTVGELRTLAECFAASDRYLESIRIAGMYMYRDSYGMEKDDLELLYPRHFTELIEKNARENDLHPSLYFGLVRTESAFSPAIASHAGAVGLAQIMPATGREIAQTIKRRGGPDYAASGAIDLTNPEINTRFGAVFLKDLANSLGSPMLALLAYNGGPARVRRLRRAAPDLPVDIFLETITIAETRNYGKSVAAAAAAYGYLYYRMSMDEVVSGIFQ